MNNFIWRMDLIEMSGFRKWIVYWQEPLENVFGKYNQIYEINHIRTL